MAPRQPPRAANDLTDDPPPRRWAIRIIRKKATLLGYVEAPDRDAAEAIAVEQLGLTDEQRQRLIITEYR